MQVRHGMSPEVLSIGPAHTLREASRLMSGRRVGAAVVLDPESPGPGILTERDILDAIGKGMDPDKCHVSDHMSDSVISAGPDWSLERAAEEMVKVGIRHLVVVDRGELVGVLSMRDIVRCWTQAGATSSISPP